MAVSVTKAFRVCPSVGPCRERRRLLFEKSPPGRAGHCAGCGVSRAPARAAATGPAPRCEHEGTSGGSSLKQ